MTRRVLKIKHHSVTLILILVITLLTTKVYAQADFFGMETKSYTEQVPADLERTIESLRKLLAAGYTREQAARFVFEKVKSQLTTCNKDNNRFSTACWTLSARKKLGWGIGPEYIPAALYAWENEVGNCNEHASLVYYILKRAGVGDDLRLLTDYISTGENDSHVFVAWGLRGESDPNDMRDWKSDAVIIDTWSGQLVVGNNHQFNPRVSDDTFNRGGNRSRHQQGLQPRPAPPPKNLNDNLIECGRVEYGVGRDVDNQRRRGDGCYCKDWSDTIERHGVPVPARKFVLLETPDGKAKCIR